MHKIVVHPGNAHRDDFLAVSILLATLDEVEVHRCDPSPEDLADPGTYVVDVGMQYDPQLRNFDHHQDRSLPCAFHLVMQDLGFHEDAQAVFGWYPFMSMMDVRGPHKTAEHFGVDASVLLASSSPIDGYILSRFSKLQTLRRQDLLYQFMREMGRDMVGLIKLKKERLERLKREAEIVSIKHVKAVVCAIGDNPKLAMELFLRSLDDDRVVICITPSVRGEGWELLRLGDSSLVDFRAIADSPEVRFVHANGYIATTRTLIPPGEVMQLAARSVVDMPAGQQM
jgi:hypothetical protein